MKYNPPTSEQYIENCLRLMSKGWSPVGDYHKKEMKFMRGYKVYDLSAADLSKLDEIEEKGLLIVKDFN